MFAFDSGDDLQLCGAVQSSQARGIPGEGDVPHCLEPFDDPGSESRIGLNGCCDCHFDAEAARAGHDAVRARRYEEVEKGHQEAGVVK